MSLPEKEGWSCHPLALPPRIVLVLVEPVGDHPNDLQIEQDPRDVGNAGERILNLEKKDQLSICIMRGELVLKLKQGLN